MLLVLSFSEPPEIRLSNGLNQCSGRVEILHEKLWGTICDDDWDLDDAKVVCQYLGCGTALSAPRGSRFGGGSGPIWLDGVNCTGSESAISKCHAKAWGEHDCTHSEDAGVICAGKEHLCSSKVEQRLWEVCDIIVHSTFPENAQIGFVSFGREHWRFMVLLLLLFLQIYKQSISVGNCNTSTIPHQEIDLKTLV